MRVKLIASDEDTYQYHGKEGVRVSQDRYFSNVKFDGIIVKCPTNWLIPADEEVTWTVVAHAIAPEFNPDEIKIIERNN